VKRVALLLATLAIVIHAAGCSAPPGDEVGNAKQEFGILVHMPNSSAAATA
jgi:hypothetical protein